MYLNWLKIAQCIAGGAILVLICAASFFQLTRNDTPILPELSLDKRSLPKSSFEFVADQYINMNTNAFHLSYSPPRPRLPDLKNSLLYYGQCGRPDISLEKPKMFFSWNAAKSVISVSDNEKVYLSYDKKLQGACKYCFSPNNEPTMIWFKAAPNGKEAQLTVEMTEAEDIASLADDVNRNISLPEKEFTRSSSLGVWEIGKWRVDGSLLVRQKARWVGVDRFLENHGGQDFPGFADKHRVDFTEGEESYSVFVKKGDYLVWEKDRWQVASPDLHSQDKPILVIRKIEEKVMSMDLWDVEGKGKVALALVKAPEAFHHEQITRDFRFVGARTKTQIVFQIAEDRLIVKPNDWLLLTKEGWRKLSTASEVDDYVSRKLVGTLFIFNEIAKNGDKTVLNGSIYNPNRTELHEIEVAMLPTGATSPNPTPGSLHEQRNPDQPAQTITPIAIH